jgi:hypothetical protein
LHRKFL